MTAVYNQYIVMFLMVSQIGTMEKLIEITLGQIDNVNYTFGWYFGNVRVHQRTDGVRIRTKASLLGATRCANACRSSCCRKTTLFYGRG